MLTFSVEETSGTVSETVFGPTIIKAIILLSFCWSCSQKVLYFKQRLFFVLVLWAVALYQAPYKVHPVYNLCTTPYMDSS